MRNIGKDLYIVYPCGRVYKSFSICRAFTLSLYTRGVSTPHRTEGAVNQTYIHFIEQGCGGDKRIVYSPYTIDTYIHFFPSLTLPIYKSGIHLWGRVLSPLFGRGRKGGVKGGRYSI